jgi:hypothetical protein
VEKFCRTFDVKLEIHQVYSCDNATAIVVVRCVQGPVRLGARFHRIQHTEAPINLELTQILAYGHPLDALDPVHAALVTLQGTGTCCLGTGSTALDWQTIQGGNPPS